MRRTAALAMIAALALAGCQDSAEESGPGQEPATSGPPTAPEEATDETEPDDEAAADDTGRADEDQDAKTGSGPTEQSTTDPAEGEDDAEAGAPDFLEPHQEMIQRPAEGVADAGQEITDVRVAGHDGFDRVVLDLTGDEVFLGWLAAYADEALGSGRGDPIEVEGTAVLALPVVGIDWLAERPERYEGETVTADTANVTEVVFGVLNEGEQQVFLGVQEQTPYRVFALEDPARIVIDVQHP